MAYGLKACSCHPLIDANVDFHLSSKISVTIKIFFLFCFLFLFFFILWFKTNQNLQNVFSWCFCFVFLECHWWWRCEDVSQRSRYEHYDCNISEMKKFLGKDVLNIPFLKKICIELLKRNWVSNNERTERKCVISIELKVDRQPDRQTDRQTDRQHAGRWQNGRDRN